MLQRMPEEYRPSAMVVAGASVADDLRRLARLVADFHARAAANGDIARQGGRAAVRGRWIANLREIDRFRGRYIDERSHDEVERLALRYLDGRGPLLAARAAAGLVR